MLLIDEPKPAPQIDFYSAPTFRVRSSVCDPKKQSSKGGAGVGWSNLEFGDLALQCQVALN